jgi:hemerythrin superfamily protein
MSLFALLKKDHQDVQKLMEDLKSSSHEKNRKQELFQSIFNQLYAHNKAEAKFVYKALKSMAEDKPLAEQSIMEHKMAEDLLDELQSTFLSLTDNVWDEKFSQLHELVLKHIQKEESEIFDELEESFEEKELKALAQAFKEEKSKILAEQ